MFVKWMIIFYEKLFPPNKWLFHLILTQPCEVHFLSFTDKENKAQRSGLSSVS